MYRSHVALLALLSACSTPGTDKDTAEVEHDPTIARLDIRSDTGTVTVGATLTCTVESSDEDEDALTTDLSWTVDGAPAGTGPTLALQAGSVGVNSVVSCLATVTDPDGGAASAAAEVIVTNLPPVVAQPALSPDVAVYNDGTVACSAIATDPEGEALTVAYTWTNETEGLPLGEGALLALDPAQVMPGDTVACTVTALDPHGASGAASSQIAVANRAPVAGTLSLTPDLPASMDTLLCELSGTTDRDGETPAVSYRWQLDGIDLTDGASLPAPHVVGDTWTCIARVSDATPGSAVEVSAAVTIQDTAPLIDDLLLDVGGNVNDSTLSCEGLASDIDGDTPTVSVLWMNDTRGTPLGDTPTLTLDATRARPWDVVTCTVTAVDAHGLAATRSASTTLDNRVPVAGGVSVTPAMPTTSDALACALDSATDPDGDPVTTLLTWTVDGATAGTGSTLPAGVLRDAGVRCTATLSDGNGGTASASADVTIADSAPTLTGLELSPAAPSTTDALVASVTAADADGDALDLVYTWTIDGVEVQSGPDATLPARSARRGQVVEVEVTGDDGTLASGTLRARVTIGNSLPSIASLGLTPSVVRTDDLLSASAVLTDADGDTPSARYDWYVNDVLVQSGPSGALDGVRHFDRDDTVRVDLHVGDGVDTGLAASRSVVVANTAPSAPVVTFTPEVPVAGEPLTCTADPGSDADGDALTYTFAWTREGVAYTDATHASGTASVILGEELLAGERWSCSVVASDGTDLTASAAIAADVVDACYDSATFTVRSTARGELETINARVKDIDEDGYDDILFPNQLSSSVTIWWGGAAGPGAAETTLPMGRTGSGVDAGDLNGDGYAEIVASNQDYSQISIAWGRAGRTFASTTTVSQGGFPTGLSLVDSDRDGDLDLVVVLSSSNCTTVRTNNGSGSFTGGACVISDAYMKWPIDVNGDGHDELIASGTGNVYSSASGSWVRTSTIDLSSIGTSNAVYPYDIDLDGDIDLAVADGRDRSLHTLKNDGSGNFSACDWTGPLAYWPNSVGDLDMDGDLDFVSVTTCSYCSSTWRIALSE